MSGSAPPPQLRCGAATRQRLPAGTVRVAHRASGVRAECRADGRRRCRARTACRRRRRPVQVDRQALRDQAVQEGTQGGGCGAEKVSRPWRDAGDEGPDPELPGAEGGGVRAGAARRQERHQEPRLLARLRPALPLRPRVPAGDQVLPRRAAARPGERADPARPVAAAGADARPRRLCRHAQEAPHAQAHQQEQLVHLRRRRAP